MSLRLVWRPRPMITWSWTVTPSGLAALMMSLVTAMSALDGVGSPDGWLCTRINADAPSSSARRAIRLPGRLRPADFAEFVVRFGVGHPHDCGEA